MRKIKFRGKDEYNGDWIFGYPLQDADIEDRWYIMNNYSDGIIVDQKTISQFTGLTDRNGKEIYEGDILLNSIGRHYLVEFYKGSYWLKCNETLYSCLLVGECSHLELIGNIHDNPELLNPQ